MERQVSNQVSVTDTIEAHDKWMGLKLLQIAGGDQAFADKMRELLWQAYCDADCPFGGSEKGMAIWWAHSQNTRSL